MEAIICTITASLQRVFFPHVAMDVFCWEVCKMEGRVYNKVWAVSRLRLRLVQSGHTSGRTDHFLADKPDLAG